MGGMAETTRRGATTDPGSGPQGELPDSVPDHIPFARAASVFSTQASRAASKHSRLSANRL